MMSGNSYCGICSIEQAEHLALEADGSMKHRFTSDGELIPVVREPKKAEPKRLVAIPDPALRALLLEKGIITYEELAAKEVEIHGRPRLPEAP
jgi:hypothetical protein